MNLLILSDSENYANSRIKKEAENLGHRAEIISPDNFIVNWDEQGNLKLFFNKKDFSDVKFHAVIPRLGTNREYGNFVLNVLIDYYGLVSTGTSLGLDTASNKLLSAYRLGLHNIPQPATTTVRDADDFNFLIKSVGGLPAIMKTFSGSKGNGVYLLQDKVQSNITVKNLRTAGFKVLLQKFIHTAKGEDPKFDIRCWVVVGKIAAAFKRFSGKDDIRSNYSISKIGEKVELTPKEYKLALNAANAIGLDCCGVDIARDINNDNSPLVYEVNGNADLKGIETVTDINVAYEIVKFVCQKVSLVKSDKIQDSVTQSGVSFAYMGEFYSNSITKIISQTGFRF